MFRTGATPGRAVDGTLRHMTNAVARVDGPFSVAIERETPVAGEPAAGQVRVTVTYTGVCGSDVHNYVAGDVFPRSVFGHEWTGTVAAVGEGVRDLAVGDRVVTCVGPPCGSCAMCTTGHADHCDTAFLEGMGLAPDCPSHGAFATSITVPRRRLTPVLDGLTDVQAALVEPTAVTFHGVKRTRQRLGDVVVVQGAGPIGLLAAQHARHAGAGCVIVVEPNEPRRATASSLGFTDVLPPGAGVRSRLDELTGGIGADVLYECTGVASLLQPSAGLVRRGGTLSLLGIADENSEVSYTDWVLRELRVVASTTYQHEDFVASMRAIADGSVDVLPLHTGTASLGELQDVLADLHSGATQHAKVLIDPRR